MNLSCTTIEQRIESCKSLLELFQKERTILQSKKEIEAKDMLPMLKLKKKLLDRFEEDAEALKSDEPTTEDGDEEAQETRDELLRELSDLLEQLLVLDRENQRLLRETLSDTQKNANKSAAKAAFAKDMA